MSDCLERWTKSDKSLNGVLKRTVSNLLFFRPVARFIEENVDSSIDKVFLTLLYAKTEKVDKKGVPLPAADRHRTQSNSREIRASKEAPNAERVNRKSACRSGPHHSYRKG